MDSKVFDISCLSLAAVSLLSRYRGYSECVGDIFCFANIISQRKCFGVELYKSVSWESGELERCSALPVVRNSSPCGREAHSGEKWR